MKWEEKEYEIIVETFGGKIESRTVIGLVSGVFGVNDRYSEPELHDDKGPSPALTHIPTQRAIAKDLTVTRAKEAAEELKKGCPSLLTAKSEGDIPPAERERARKIARRYR